MRLLHTMLRVGDLQRSIDFYTKVMGMTLLRQSENPSQNYSLAFVGFGKNPEHAEIEFIARDHVHYGLGGLGLLLGQAETAAWLSLSFGGLFGLFGGGLNSVHGLRIVFVWRLYSVIPNPCEWASWNLS